MTRRVTQVALVALVLVGFALRIYRLDRDNFRGDEAFTVQYWMLPTLNEALTTYITLDPQPPLAYAAYNTWGKLVGLSEFAVRVLPALAGTLGIPILYQFVMQVYRSAKSRSLALLAALLWTVHPFLIWHSQDARNYALWSTMSLLGLWLALRALQHYRPKDWIIYIVVAAATGYLYYLELFVWFALSLFVLIAYWRQWHVYIKWAGAMLTIGAILAPWYLQPQIRSGGGYGGTTTGFQLHKLLTEFPTTLSFGSTVPPASEGVLWLAVLLGIGCALVVTYRQDRQLALLLGLLGVVPSVLLSVIALQLNILAPRYVLGSVPAFVVLAAILIHWLWIHQRIVGFVLLTAWLAVVGVTIHNSYFVQQKAPEWTSLTTYLDEAVSDSHLVIQTSTDPAFGYYYNIAQGVSADERALPASPDQSPEAIHAALEEAAREYDAVWLAAQGFTDWASYGVVEAWMQDNMQLVVDTNAAGLRAQQYRTWDVNEAEIPNGNGEPLATFGDVAELMHVEVLPSPQPTGELVVWVYWQPLQQTDQPLKAFVHLVGAYNPASNSPLWSQDDKEPQRGRASTTIWQPNAHYRDVFMLPDVATLPPDEYTLTLGLYDPGSGERIATLAGEDAYTITVLQLP